MALTKKDKQFILETISDSISSAMSSQMVQIRYEMQIMEKRILATINGLKISMETEFRSINRRFESTDKLIGNHEGRIMILEDKSS